MPAYLAVALAAVLFAVIFVPVLAWESRRQGRILPSRVLGAAMFSVYALALVTYTLIPLPTEEWCAANSAMRVPCSDEVGELRTM